MSFYSDFQGLEEIRVNDNVYVNKKQLLELIKGEQKRYREGTESGYLNLSKKQTIAVDLSLNHLKVLLCKRYYDNLRKDMFKYLITSCSDEVGTLVYFSNWCKNLPGNEGKEVPVFCDDPNKAYHFENREEANETITKIHEQWPKQDIAPVQVCWTYNEPGLKRIHSFMGWPSKRDMDEVLSDEISYRRKPE